MKEKENNKEGDTKDYLKVRDLRNRSYRLPSSTAKPKDKKGDSNKRIENMPGSSQSSQDHHSASMMREIRDEVTKYYEGKHFYSVYQNAIWEYLRPLATNSCDLDFDDNLDDLDFS